MRKYVQTSHNVNKRDRKKRKKVKRESNECDIWCNKKKEGKSEMTIRWKRKEMDEHTFSWFKYIFIHVIFFVTVYHLKNIFWFY